MVLLRRCHKGLTYYEEKITCNYIFSKRVYFFNNITGFFFKLLPDFTTKVWNVTMGTRLACDQLELLISWIKAMKMLEDKVNIKEITRIIKIKTITKVKMILIKNKKIKITRNIMKEIKKTKNLVLTLIITKLSHHKLWSKTKHMMNQVQ